ncbi:PREDICTED: WD repeat-containing protein 66-like [Dinoponera quadriceps]|uniref:Cilia- and flagella-associated protein 251 n=1 Tax=Dinoponera quadriceps TaxID=609295 RepID=A0A6P3XYG7_DINQU|nr:PREDICTED: WD repeat-containing protein 66-like [Dinoponera quadriceps]
MYTTAASIPSEFPLTDAEEVTRSFDVDARKTYPEAAKRDFCPFRFRWSFGINPAVPIVNLTTDNRTSLAYACSHMAVMYDYSSEEVSPLQGHQNAVRTLSTTRDGEWLLTADFEEDCTVVVWSTEKRQILLGETVKKFNRGNYALFSCRLTCYFNTGFLSAIIEIRRAPVYTLFHPHGNESMTAARISPNAKYVVTVGNGKCQDVHFWLRDEDKPNASISLTDTTSERVKEVIFNDECPEQFALTTDYHVLFLTWDGDALNYNCPKVSAKLRRTGIFNGSCYVSKVKQVFTATANGCILIWGDVPPEGKRETDDPSYRRNQRKKHIKTVDLQKCNITVITDYEDMLVTGNSDGRIAFYDYQLRLLYWYKNCDLDCIRWISFDLRSDLRASTIEKPSHPPTDATLHCSPFNVQTFLACSCTGIIALIDIPKQKYYSVLRHSVVAATSLDANPESNHVVVGDAQGTVRLYNHEELVLITSRSTLDFQPILEEQIMSGNVAFVTCPQTHESLRAVTAVKFSPRCDMLTCGLENGALWILHHITLDLLNETPYKHSATAINKITFTQCAGYMAYADNALTVVVFKRSNTASTGNTWDLIGKHHSHYLPIRDILFGLSGHVSDSKTPRFFSLGEDQELVEYDLEHSGPYPEPGLKILHIKRIEHTATPLCLARYPGNGNIFVISNSEVLTDELVDDKGYMVFATDREIGLQLLPLDGNPYKIHSMTGHPQKIMDISVSSNKEIMFTIGYNDPCVLIWEINFNSVDIVARSGGRGISPYHCLIEGGEKGWLMNEMKDLFDYAQILHQGEYTTVARVITDTVTVERIPNLMRAVGYYPSNEEVNRCLFRKHTRVSDCSRRSIRKRAKPSSRHSTRRFFQREYLTKISPWTSWVSNCRREKTRADKSRDQRDFRIVGTLRGVYRLSYRCVTRAALSERKQSTNKKQ